MGVNLDRWADHCPPLLTYGVELEFLVQFVLGDGKDIHHPQKPPSVTRLPQTLVDELSHFSPSSESWKKKVSSFLQTLIREVLRDARVPVEPDVYPPTLKEEYPRALEDLPTRRLLRYQKWVVKGDDTVCKPPENGYGYAGIEVTTPRLDGTDASFMMVRYVVNLLTAKFRITVNDTCGLHVHVGCGGGFDLTGIRRIMGILYSADRLLATLHPPIRRFNRWAPSIRDRSGLARGMTASDCSKPPDGYEPHCHEFIGREVRFGEESFLWRQLNNCPKVRQVFLETRKPGHYEAFQWAGEGVCNAHPNPRMADILLQDTSHLDEHKTKSACSSGDEGGGAGAIPHESLNPANTTFSRRRSATTSTPGSYIPDEEHFPVEVGDGHHQLRKLPCIAVRSFTPEEEEELRARGQALDEDGAPLHDKSEEDPGTFHGLGQIFSARSSCIIERLLASAERPNYSIEKYSCHVTSYPDEMAPTLEFREAAGSMDAAWVTTWARICHGLATWALNASLYEYLEVVTHCDSGQIGEIRYDVVDLLGDVSLATESRAAESRIQKNMDSWGLEYWSSHP